MKKALIVFAIMAVVIAACCTPFTAYAEGADFKQSEAYSTVKEICSYERKGGVQSSAVAAGSIQEYLINKLHQYAPNAETSAKTFTVNGSEYYFNVEAKLNKTGSDKQIIIGAHYDSVGEGATDNACGAAAVLAIAKSLSQQVDKLPCNVTFVLFDGEEDGLLGSQNYVGAMSAADRENTLVMFNIDSIANGDNLYLWCENKHTDLADLIKSNTRNMSEKPYAKGTVDLYDPYGYGYYEAIQGSDHTPFRLAGIPTALTFSGAYSNLTWSYVENSNPNNRVMNTSRDTFEYLENNVGVKFVDRINDVAQGIEASVLSQDFLNVATGARAQLLNLKLWYTSLWAYLIALAVVIALVVIIVLHYRKLQKKAILGTAEIKNTHVFTTPDADDIFTFKK